MNERHENNVAPRTLIRDEVKNINVLFSNARKKALRKTYGKKLHRQLVNRHIYPNMSYYVKERENKFLRVFEDHQSAPGLLSNFRILVSSKT
ncbi:hypothetical protein CR513_57171, partial [Mucuna pruriens]